MIEDDYRIPACIAVGDNVGDIAGKGADLFVSFAESTCAALILAAASPALDVHFASMMFPILISIVGILVGFITLLVRSGLYPVTEEPSVEKALEGVLVIITILMIPTVLGFSDD